MFHSSVRGVSKSSHAYVCWSCLLQSNIYTKNRHLSTPAAFSASAPRPTEDVLLLAGNVPLKDGLKNQRVPALRDGKNTSTNIASDQSSQTTEVEAESRGKRDRKLHQLSNPAVRQSGKAFNPYKNADVREKFPLMTKRERKLFAQSQYSKENTAPSMLDPPSPKARHPTSPKSADADLDSNAADEAASKERSANQRSLELMSQKPNEDLDNLANFRDLKTAILQSPPKSTTVKLPMKNGRGSARLRAKLEDERSRIPKLSKKVLKPKSAEASLDPTLQTLEGDTDIQRRVLSGRTQESQVDEHLEDAANGSATKQLGKPARKTVTTKVERSTTETPTAKKKKKKTALTTVRTKKRVVLRKVASLRIRKINPLAPRKVKSVSIENGRMTKSKSGSSLLKNAGERIGQATVAEDVQRTEVDSQRVAARDIDILPLDAEKPPVPSLSYGLERVLFNPGVYHLQDPRSRVFNFDPYLQKIMPVSEFDFDSLKEYITSSRDEVLRDLALANGRKYIGSSSSMTSSLAHFHFLLSQWREINVEMLSRGFPAPFRSFTKLQRGPSAIFLRWKNGVYAIDADKEFDSANVLMSLGRSMEKLLTLPMSDFERYRRSNEEKVSEEERATPEAYHYSTSGDFLMRSQLDAYDERLPGTGMFDLKTRAVVSIRMDAKNYEKGMGYQIKDRFGEWESYEREYFDMIRSAFLKYSLQVRMGRMDGIFVAFHNIERIFGFQYISLPEMDQSLHGDSTTKIGDEEFKLSIHLFNKLLDRATEKFPNTSLRLHFETRDTQSPFMYVFAEPVTEEKIQIIQTGRKKEVEAFERKILGLQRKDEQISAEAQDSLDVSTSLDSADESAEEGTTTSLASEVSGETEPTADMDTADCQSVAHTLDSQDVGGYGLLFADLTSSNDVGDESIAEIDGNEVVQETRVESVNKSVAEEATPELDSAEAMDATCSASNGIRGSDVSDSGPDSGSGLSERAEDSDAPGDVMFLDDLARRDNQGSEKSPALLGMTLSIQNKVDDKPVKRPDKLQPHQKWTVEYQISEIKESRTRSLYEMCKKRRQTQLAEVEEDPTANYYLRKLHDMSSKGKRWRDEQEKAHGKEQIRFLSRP